MTWPSNQTLAKLQRNAMLSWHQCPRWLSHRCRMVRYLLYSLNSALKDNVLVLIALHTAAPIPRLAWIVRDLECPTSVSNYRPIDDCCGIVLIVLCFRATSIQLVRVLLPYHHVLRSTDCTAKNRLCFLRYIGRPSIAVLFIAVVRLARNKPLVSVVAFSLVLTS